MKVAALDLGSNTFLCLVAEVQNGKIEKIYQDEVRLVRLGQGMYQAGSDGKKSFHPEALSRAKTCLQEFSLLIKKAAPEKILAMATAAAREASNGSELFDIGKSLNIPIEIISGNREAEITYLGSISGQKTPSADIMVIDIGGASTEIILGHGDKLEHSQSLSIGCVRLKEKFLATQPASKEQLKRLRENIYQQLFEFQTKTPERWKSTNKKLALAVAGTPTELARIEIGEFIPEKIDGFHISGKMLDSWYEKFASRTPEQIAKDFSVSPGRADVLLVGVIILQEFLKVFAIDAVEVSTRGVRFGVAIEIEKRERERKI